MWTLVQQTHIDAEVKWRCDARKSHPRLCAASSADWNARLFKLEQCWMSSSVCVDRGLELHVVPALSTMFVSWEPGPPCTLRVSARETETVCGRALGDFVTCLPATITD